MLRDYLFYHNIKVVSQVCSLADKSPGQCYWRLIPSDEAEFPSKITVMTEMAFELIKEGANQVSRIYLIAFATMPITLNPSKLKFIEGLTYAIQCAAFGFDEEKHNDSAYFLTHKMNVSNVVSDPELDLKNFNPSEPINVSLAQTSRDDADEDKFDAEKGAVDASSMMSNANLSRFPAATLERSTSSKKSGRIFDTIKGERSNSSNVIPKNIPTWEPSKPFHYPIALLPVQWMNLPGDLSMASFTDIRHLADGSNANVFLAQYKDETVIIKMIKEAAINNPLAVHEFDLEHGLLARMDHPNVIKILGSGNNPRRFLVLEYMGKGTLTNLLKKHVIIDECTLPERLFRKPSFTYFELITHAKEIAMAFDYIHRQCHSNAIILHRDLKPDNIGIDDAGHAKLMDFGLGHVIKSTSNADDVFEMSGFTGSLRYMAPEVALRQAYNEKADVFSFGILLWQMASDRVPFPDKTRDSFVQTVSIEGERPELDPLWPLPFQELLTNCWAKQASDRPTFKDIVHELRGMLAMDRTKSSQHITAVVVDQKGCCLW